MRALKTFGLVIALSAMLAPGARAQGPGTSNAYQKLTYLTFSGPVQVPGMTLPAGTYRFQMAPIETGSAHAVQIFSEDGKKLFTTFLALPDERTEAADKTVVLFSERPAGAAQAVKEWFYPGSSTGEEFVYPKSTAVEIAKANHTSVPAVEDESAKDANALKGAKVARVDEHGNAAEKQTAANEPSKSAPAASTTTAAAASTTASSATTTRNDGAVATSGQASAATRTSTANDNTNTQTRRELPRTASTLPVLALFSVLALGGGFVTSRLRRQFTV